MSQFFRSESCKGEKCTLCGAPADLKVGEEIMHDDPNPYRHNWTAYICGDCGDRLFAIAPHCVGRVPRGFSPLNVGYSAAALITATNPLFCSSCQLPMRLDPIGVYRCPRCGRTEFEIE